VVDTAVPVAERKDGTGAPEMSVKRLPAARIYFSWSEMNFVQ
jgi:hypothetical protein